MSYFFSFSLLSFSMVFYYGKAGIFSWKLQIDLILANL